MKLAVLSESPADDAALRILVDALLGKASEAIEPRSVRRRSGYGSLATILPPAISELHFNSDADALALLVDSNGDPIHTIEHEKPGAANAECRLCALRELVARVCGNLAPRTHQAPLKITIGLASPAVEAWYQCGIDPHATEVAWARELAAGKHAPQYIRTLKRAVYGTDRPSLALEIERATEAARRLAGNLTELETHFPGGFGALARDIRSWRATQ